MDSQRTEASGRPTSRTLSELGHIAGSYGYRLHMRHLDDPDVLAVTDTVAGTITFDFGLTPSEQRAVIAHEVAHAHFGHDCSTPRNEREADAWAADLLVDAPTYAALEREGHCVHDIAEHFGVTERTVIAFQTHCLQKLGRVTYGIKHRGRFTNPLARALAQ